MNYIRTKDAIYTLSESYWAGIEDEIIAQADTIEELCDYFVHKKDYKNTIFEKMRKPKREDEIALLVNPLTRNNGFVAQGISKTMLQLGDEIYGAIWTPKGLIYVAKMNEKGKLELI